MAPATAATAIFILFYSAVFTADVFINTFEFSCMAGGAIRCILHSRPRKCTIDTTAVTAVTTRVPSVVTRVVAVRVMGEVGRCPPRCCVADIALYRRAQVVDWLEACAAAFNMTIVTSSGAAGIM